MRQPIEAAPSLEREPNGDLRVGSVRAIDFFRGLRGQRGFGAGADRDIDGHPVAARHAPARVDEHALAAVPRAREAHLIAAALGDAGRRGAARAWADDEAHPAPCAQGVRKHAQAR